VFYLLTAVLLSILLFTWLKERALYLLFLWAYIQNFVLAWMYTSGWAGKELCQALLLVKEFLLLWLFFHFLPQLKQCGGGKWPLPLRILGFFTAWCFLRYIAAVLLQGQSLVANLWNLRIASFPLQILTVAIGISFTKPEFAIRFIRHMAYLAGAVAFIALLIYLISEPTFWRDQVNVARYNSEVKGESGGDSPIQQQLGGEDAQEQAQGLPGNARGREEFSFLSAFRVIGTVCDAVGFGHLVAFPLLLFAFWLPQSWNHRLLLGLILASLFFTFTRSAWIFVLLSCGFVLLRKKKYRLVLSVGGGVAIAIAIWTPLAEWYSETMALLSWTNPQEDHAEGLVWLYKEGLWQMQNIFGQGLTARVYESGYGILLVRYGLPALISILWFFIALYCWLRRSPLRDRPLFLLAQAVPLAMIVIMNTSYYPFSFIPYLLTWFVVGTCLATAAQESSAQGSLERRLDVGITE
jgi:hypothetical protein